jgi:hypothetical protein
MTDVLEYGPSFKAAIDEQRIVFPPIEAGLILEKVLFIDASKKRKEFFGSATLEERMLLELLLLSQHLFTVSAQNWTRVREGLLSGREITPELLNDARDLVGEKYFYESNGNTHRLFGALKSSQFVSVEPKPNALSIIMYRHRVLE